MQRNVQINTARIIDSSHKKALEIHARAKIATKRINVWLLGVCQIHYLTIKISRDRYTSVAGLYKASDIFPQPKYCGSDYTSGRAHENFW